MPNSHLDAFYMTTPTGTSQQSRQVFKLNRQLAEVRWAVLVTVGQLGDRYGSYHVLVVSILK